MLRKSALNSADSELFLSETALFSSETELNFSVLNSADSEKIRADQFWNRADQRWCLSCSLNQRWKTSKLWNSAVQRWLPLGLQPGHSFSHSWLWSQLSFFGCYSSPLDFLTNLLDLRSSYFYQFMKTLWEFLCYKSTLFWRRYMIQITLSVHKFSVSAAVKSFKFLNSSI